MSAFTDWNGGGSCGGNSLPGMVVLQDLITKLNTYKSELDTYVTVMNNHIGSNKIVTSPGHANASSDLTTIINNALTSINSSITALQGAVGTVQTGTNLQAQITAIKGGADAAITLQALANNLSAIKDNAATTTTLRTLQLAIDAISTSITTVTVIVGTLKTDTIQEETSGHGVEVISKQHNKADVDIAADNKLQVDKIDAVEANSSTRNISNLPADGIKIINDLHTRNYNTHIGKNVFKQETELSRYVDFTKWILSPGYVYSTQDASALDPPHIDHPVMLLAEISSLYRDYDNSAVSKFTVDNDRVAPSTLDSDANNGNNVPDQGGTTLSNNNMKSARLYVKYVNTKPWNAILDVTVTRDTDTGVDTGTVFSQVSFTASRLTESDIDVNANIPGYMDAVNPECRMLPFTFGIYRSTNSSGKVRYYIGVLTYEIKQQNSTGQVFNQRFYITGVNIRPITSDNLPNGAVHAVKEVWTSESGAVSVSDMIVDKLKTNGIYDLEDNPILIVNNIDDTITLGNKDGPHDLTIYADERPDVILGEPGAQYTERMAFLSDLISSTYFQREVLLSTKTFADLQNLKVTLSAGGTTSADIIQWDPDGNNVPGIYFTNPESNTVSGLVFGDTSSGIDWTNKKVVALIRDSGQKTNTPLADGWYDDDVTKLGGAPYVIPRASITALDTVTLVTDANKGSYYPTIVANKSTTIPIIKLTNDSSQDTFIFDVASSNDWQHYTYPQYAYWDDTSSAWVQSMLIAIPTYSTSEDKVINTIAYEWSGYNEVLATGSIVPYFQPGYMTWVAHHENINAYPDYGAADEERAWAMQTLSMDGYRTSLAQDEIDNVILGVAASSADYSLPSDYVQPESVDSNGKNSTIQITLPSGDKRTIANPNYIANKPNRGISDLNGGNFTSPGVWYDAIFNGGNFDIKLPTSANEPPVNHAAAFRNAIMHIMQGQFDAVDITTQQRISYLMPDWAPLPDGSDNYLPSLNYKAAMRDIFGYVLRWTTFAGTANSDKGELILNDPSDSLVEDNGNNHGMQRFIPINKFKQPEEDGAQRIVQQGVLEAVSADNTIVVTIKGTDFGVLPGGTAAFEYTFTIDSDEQATAASDDVQLTLQFTQTAAQAREDPGLITISSPRLNVLTNELRNEIAERQAADEALQGLVDDEAVERATADEQLAAQIMAEQERAVNEETQLAGQISTVNDACTQLQADLVIEIGRAQTAEQKNANDIAAENTRAQREEETLRETIDAETARAEAAEQENANNITGEAERAIAAEQENSLAIQTEADRAQYQENELLTQINANQEYNDGVQADLAANKLSKVTTGADNGIRAQASDEDGAAHTAIDLDNDDGVITIVLNDGNGNSNDIRLHPDDEYGGIEFENTTRIHNVADPVEDNDAATKNYVDTEITSAKDYADAAVATLNSAISALPTPDARILLPPIPGGTNVYTLRYDGSIRALTWEVAT